MGLSTECYEDVLYSVVTALGVRVRLWEEIKEEAPFLFSIFHHFCHYPRKWGVWRCRGDPKTKLWSSTAPLIFALRFFFDGRLLGVQSLKKSWTSWERRQTEKMLHVGIIREQCAGSTSEAVTESTSRSSGYNLEAVVEPEVMYRCDNV